jgi:hypothetical protein
MNRFTSRKSARQPGCRTGHCGHAARSSWGQARSDTCCCDGCISRRRALRAAAPTSTTVTEIAVQYGFLAIRAVRRRIPTALWGIAVHHARSPAGVAVERRGPLFGISAEIEWRAVRLTSIIAAGILADLCDNRRLQVNTKHLLNGFAVIAALAFSAPVWAQPANPTPYNTGTPTGRGFGPKASGGNYVPSATTATGTAASSTSATPPKHHHAHHATHAATHHHKMAPLTGSTANQLNQQELARLQMGSSMPPPAPMGATPSPSGGNSMGMPGPNTGGPGQTPYSTGFPHESEHGTVQR